MLRRMIKIHRGSHIWKFNDHHVIRLPDRLVLFQDEMFARFRNVASAMRGPRKMKRRGGAVNPVRQTGILVLSECDNTLTRQGA
jgi:hypothetical protein